MDPIWDSIDDGHGLLSRTDTGALNLDPAGHGWDPWLPGHELHIDTPLTGPADARGPCLSATNDVHFGSSGQGTAEVYGSDGLYKGWVYTD